MATTIVFKNTKKWCNWYDILYMRDWNNKSKTWQGMTSYAVKAITIFNDEYAASVLQELKAARVGIVKVEKHK